MLFRISLAIFHILEKKLMQCQSREQVQQIIENLPALVQDPMTLLHVADMPKYKVSSQYIQEQRDFYRKQIIEEDKSYKRKSEKFNRNLFLDKFPLFKGLKQKKMRSSNQTPEEMIEQITCNKKWPVCFLDSTFELVVHDFFVFTCKYDVITDYFAVDNLSVCGFKY